MRTAGMLAGKRFLVAEDNGLIRDAVCEMLETHGAQAIPAEDGAQAVRAFSALDAGGFDAVLMDVCMPGMDGYAAARAIRRMDRRILIFAHTDAGGTYSAGEALKNGMDGCIPKLAGVGELARLMHI